MSVKATAFIGAHYPNTFMEQFCRSIHPGFDLGPLCVSWFRQATKHCTELLVNVKAPSMYFWTTVKNFIFPETHTELMSQKIPIRIHPKRLTMQDCQSLFLDIVNDYVLRAPRYAAESTTNVMLWQVLYSLVGIMTLASLLLASVFTYSKYRQSQEKPDPMQDIFKPNNCLNAAVKRSLNMAKREVRQLQVEPILQPEEIIAPDGTPVLAIKLCHKYEVLNGIVSGSGQNSAQLYRRAEQHDPTKSEFKVETVEKALRFLGSNARKLRLLLFFEDEPFDDNKVVTKSKGIPICSGSRKSSQIPNKHNRIIKSIGSGSLPFGSTLKQMTPYIVGESTSPRRRCGSKKTFLDAASGSGSLPGSPQKQIISPNCPRHSPSLGAKKYT